MRRDLYDEMQHNPDLARWEWEWIKFQEDQRELNRRAAESERRVPVKPKH